jgi:RNA polymerase sigma-70 factor (ECF subfamily)
MDDLSEKEIIQKIKNGEIDYFETLVERFSKIIYFYTKKKIANAQDIEDIVQNSFIKAYKGITKFDTKKTFYPYLFTIVKNEIADYYRKKKPEFKINDQTATYEQSFEDTTANFKGLLANLRGDYKTVVTLYYHEGYSYKEIAKKINKPVNTVKTLLYRAKNEIKESYEKR